MVHTVCASPRISEIMLRYAVNISRFNREEKTSGYILVYTDI